MNLTFCQKLYAWSTQISLSAALINEPSWRINILLITILGKIMLPYILILRIHSTPVPAAATTSKVTHLQNNWQNCFMLKLRVNIFHDLQINRMI